MPACRLVCRAMGKEKGGDFSAVQEEAMRSRILDAIIAYMEGMGYVSCTKEGAERTICVVHTMKGWSLFDDCADRLNIAALDGLGRGLTRRLHTHGVGVMCSGEGMLFRLYADGKLKDAYLSAKGKRRLAGVAAFGGSAAGDMPCAGGASWPPPILSGNWPMFLPGASRVEGRIFLSCG